MKLCDVNVLVYALRADCEQHARAVCWLEALINDPATYAVSPQILGSLVRVVTNPRIFRNPTGLSEVMDFCDVLMSQPNATLLFPGDRHWKIFQNYCEQLNLSGNIVQDAWWAALALEWGCEWVSLDGDFGRFPGLNWSQPF
ncbi:MAG: type II toxin-antitoxin system VapC family toxin [Nitrospirales bacterium]